MKRIIMLAAAMLIAAVCALPALAVDNYSFDATPQADFGTPTSTESISVDYPNPDIKTNKDSAVIPPRFGSPSMDMTGTGEYLTPNLMDGQTQSPASAGTVTYPDSYTTSTSTVTYSDNFTLPTYYSDGSIGTLQIPRFNLSLKVYETESLESLAKGVGHFKSTSAWDGNIGIAGHNRGVNSHFGNIRKLVSGDRIIYTTQYGTRTYEVYFVGQISETDFSRLGRTESNMITLITCVNNQPTLRICVQAREVK